MTITAQVEPGTLLISEQMTDLSWQDAWRTELRGSHGEWVRGPEAEALRVAAPGTLTRQILDLAGWDTAWLFEKRGRGGEWVKSLPDGWNQPTFPGMPRGSGPPPWQTAEHKLDTDLASGIKSETKPHAKRGLHQGEGANFFGNTADTAVVTFSNGHKWVRKTNMPSDEYENEVLASRVSDMIGAGAPDVVERTGDDGEPHLWEPYLTGSKTAIEWEGGQDDEGEPLDEEHDPYEMYTSENGIRIGILDNLLGNEDRHEGNWMVAHSRRTGEDTPLPIDHGGISFGESGDIGFGPFGETLFNDPELLSEIPADQWSTWERKLGTLQASFAEMGRDYDYQTMMTNFEAMRAQAGAT